MANTVIAGNWKMFKVKEEAQACIEALKSEELPKKIDVMLAVPFTSIEAAVESAEGSSIQIGAQNMNDASEGAFTGEISSTMLKDVGAQFTLLGHSERRVIFGEDNTFINKKVLKAKQEELPFILCIGETLEELEAGKTEEVLKTQLLESLEGINIKNGKGLIVAYEPVWAIGTGKSATPELAEERHAFCREVLFEIVGKRLGKSTPLLYGGSVKASNVKELLAQKNIDGVLVGGASLEPSTFIKIIQA